MNRRVGLTLLTSALTVAMLAAQEEPPPNDQPGAKKTEQKKGKPAVRELEKKPPRPEPATGEDVKKIIERLNKNMDTSEERLQKKDPGDETRKVQTDIVKDLDELIKQQSQSPSGGGGGGGSASASSQQSKGSKSSSGGSSSGGEQSGQSAKGGGKSKGGAQADSKSNQGGVAKGDQTKAGQAKSNSGQTKNGPDMLGKKNGDSQDDGKQTAKSEPGKEGQGGGGMGGKQNASTKKDNTTIGDLFKDVWGHLPLNKRQEMDAYARERFLPKYDEILRQYYRTISEQGRHKDGE